MRPPDAPRPRLWAEGEDKIAKGWTPGHQVTTTAAIEAPPELADILDRLERLPSDIFADVRTVAKEAGVPNLHSGHATTEQLALVARTLVGAELLQAERDERCQLLEQDEQDEAFRRYRRFYPAACDCPEDRAEAVLMANRGKLDRLPEPSDWDTVDLVEVVRHPGEPMEPSVLRFDGEDVGLFYASKLNGIHGDSGVGKSWLALIAAAQELMHFGGVLWIDFESTAQETVHRLMALGVPVDRIVSSFHYISPDSAMDETVVSRLLAMLRRSDADLVVIDSLGEAFGLEGINENNDNEVTPFFRRVVRPITDAEFTVLLIDHQAKSSEHPLHASGSKRKRAAMTGSSFLVEAPQPFDKGRGGRLKLTTAKDRGGHFGRGKPAAFIDIDVWPDGGITYHVTRPSTTDAKAEDIKLLLATKAAVKAARDLGQEAPMSVLEAQMGIKASATVKRAGIEHAAMLGSLTESAGKRGSRLFRYCQDLPEEFGR